MLGGWLAATLESDHLELVATEGPSNNDGGTAKAGKRRKHVYVWSRNAGASRSKDDESFDETMLPFSYLRNNN